MTCIWRPKASGVCTVCSVCLVYLVYLVYFVCSVGEESLFSPLEDPYLDLHLPSRERIEVRGSFDILRWTQDRRSG
jgi:hypothetical protein